MIKATRLLSLLIFTAVVFACQLAFAQHARLYLNTQEIAPQSVHFLEAATIDSINFYPGAEAHEKLNLPTQGVDSVFVIFKKDMSDVVSYYQLLDLFHFDERARLLPLNLGSVKHEYVEKAKLMMFNIKYVNAIDAEIRYVTKMDYIHIFQGYRRPYNSPAGKMLTWLQGYIEGIGDNFYYKKFKK